jgi:N-acetylmuramoyl-L-alanine amidase
MPAALALLAALSLLAVLPVLAAGGSPSARHAAKSATAREPRKPRIVWDPIPFGPERKAQMVAYVRRHYGSFMKPTWRLIHPHGTIHQLVSLGTMCRHTVGLNWTAIGIEHVGYSNDQVLDNHRQVTASLELVHWLSCRYKIKIKNVIGHNESLSSPYHHEDVPSLRDQTPLTSTITT